MNIIELILVLVIVLSQLGAFMLISSLAKRIRNIDLSNKIGDSHDEYAKKCKKGKK
tara:strand:+ start:13785 stop:13952 length:168 start_codon:yes stop_codon:yes gene_type:complete